MTMATTARVFAWTAAVIVLSRVDLSLASDLVPSGDIVISEISYNPPPELGPDSALEFVEIHNRSDAPVDLSGWRLKDADDAHEYRIPGGVELPPGGDLVIARDPASLRAVYGDDVEAVGPFDFGLGNGGDTVRLFDTAGLLVDRVEYEDDGAWPVEADANGATLERISLSSDRTDFANFAASDDDGLPGTPGAVNSRSGEIPSRHAVVISEVQYHPVVLPGASPLLHCSDDEFIEIYNGGSTAIDISGWRFADGIRYEFPAGTEIGPGEHLALFRDREAFESKYGSDVPALGPYAGALDNGGERVLLVDAESRPVDVIDYDDTFPWPVNPDGIRGSIELVDTDRDNDRGGAWRASRDPFGSPGRTNSVRREFLDTGSHSGPQVTKIRAVAASDRDRRELTSRDRVIVEARILDRDGVSDVALEWQVCSPGDYIPRTDERFDTEWNSMRMRYDVDSTVFTAVLEPFPHRTLVRYRIRATDAGESPVSTDAPTREDPEPNLAFFVYDGVPDYIASERSAFGDPGYVHTGLDRVPVYHVIGRAADIESLLYERFPLDDVYRWHVTFVHEGRVHDHCRIRLRTGHRYSWPKRALKIRFNKGNLFRGRFNDGERYPSARRTLNLNTAQHDPGKPRGESGVFETLAWKLFRDAGVFAATTTLIQLRIVRSPDEHAQFDGDFFGVYLEVQSLDEQALKEQGRPAGEADRLYKMAGAPEKRHPDCDLSTDDVDAFMAGYETNPGREWYDEHLHLERYFAFRSVVELADNHDMDSLKNFYYYFDSESRRWEVVPWDLDNTFGAQASGDEPLSNRVLPLYPAESRNHLRHAWQLLYDERRMFSMIDELRELIGPLADADQDRWDTEPRVACPTWPSRPEGNCLQYRSFEVRMRELKRWIRSRSKFVRALFVDPAAPRAPSSALAWEDGPLARPIVLRSSEFDDPDPGDLHSASRWLVIERGGDWAEPLWEWTSTVDLSRTSVPDEALPDGGEFLFRVAHRDTSGRWSLYSEPSGFSAGVQAAAPGRPRSLRAESVGAGLAVIAWSASEGDDPGVGYRLFRDNVSVTSKLLRTTRYADFEVVPGSAPRYHVTAVSESGLESEPSEALVLSVPLHRAFGPWRVPPDGFDFVYDARPGEDVYDAEGRAHLDGHWASASVDAWDGSAPGEPFSAPGGAGVVVLDHAGVDGQPASVLTIEDPGPASTVFPTPSNERIYLLRDLGAVNPFVDGFTVVARFRVHPAPVDVDPEAVAFDDAGGRGHVGIVHRGRSTRANLSLWLDRDRLRIGERGDVSVRPSEFVCVWLTAREEGDGHRVQVFVDGRTVPAFDERISLPTRGTERAFDGNYLQLGLAGNSSAGALQVDAIGFADGVHSPIRAPDQVDPYRRGDLDADRALGLDDVLLILDYLFSAPTVLPCPDAADVDDSGRIDLVDAMHLVHHLFTGGPAPAPPRFECGLDPTPDRLNECAAECR